MDIQQALDEYVHKELEENHQLTIVDFEHSIRIKLFEAMCKALASQHKL